MNTSTHRPRRTLAFTVLVAAVVVPTAGALASVDTEPPAEIAAADSAAPPASAPVVIVDSSGVAVADVTVGEVVPQWSDHPDDDAPDTGREYLRITVTVTSRVARGVYEVDDDQFVLQDTDGFLFEGFTMATAAQDAAGGEIADEAVLAADESVTFELTFHVVAGVGPEHLFFAAADDQLVTITSWS